MSSLGTWYLYKIFPTSCISFSKQSLDSDRFRKVYSKTGAILGNKVFSKQNTLGMTGDHVDQMELGAYKAGSLPT